MKDAFGDHVKVAMDGHVAVVTLCIHGLAELTAASSPGQAAHAQTFDWVDMRGSFSVC